jgi:glycerol-3-phosphate O-acyltransferase / dihydroxyacetone phosphate acyltransferase
VRVPLKYGFFRLAVRAILHLYYRVIEVYGRSFIPRTGRTLIIANHQTGLIDGLVIVATHPSMVRTLAKNTLWENPIIRVFANGLGMIPVYRKQDVTADAVRSTQSAGDRNKEAFDLVTRSFENNEFVLLFPEGKSHDNSYILRLRSGAARMLLSSEAAHDFRLGVKWVPLSLDFEKKHQPGTRILLHYHPARSVTHLRDLYYRDPEAAVEQLRLEMEDYLKEITINFASWPDRVFIERLTEIWLARSPANHLLDRHNFLLKWKRIMENTAVDDQAQWEQLRASVRHVYASLTLLNLKPTDIYRRSPKGQRRLYAKAFFRMAVWGPLISAGLIFWYPPTWLVRFIARKWAPSMDVRSSYQIVAGVAAFPLWLLIAFPMILGFFDQTVSLGLFILAIATGLAALTVSRNLSPEIREVLALYRYGSLNKFIEDMDMQIEAIWKQAARLWNRGLRRQVLIETLSSAEDENESLSSDKADGGKPAA